MFFILQLFAFAAYVFNGASGTTHLRGATALDSFTFDKMLSKFKVAIVKFDEALPYGKEEEEYGKIAESLRFSPDILVAEVGIQDYAEKRNLDLADRFGVKTHEFPIVKVFVQGKTDPVTFSGDFKAFNLKKFIKKHSSVRIVLDNCVQELDELAEKFMNTRKLDEQVSILERARQFSQNLRNEDEIKSAGLYLKMMQKVIEKGSSAISQEKGRANSALRGKVTFDRRQEIQTILNILQSFSLKRLRDEL